MSNPIGTLCMDAPQVEDCRADSALAESECCFHTLCEASLAGIFIVQNGSIKYANPVLARMLGYGLGELLGVTPLGLTHADDRDLIASRLRSADELETSRYEARCLRKDGEVVHVEILSSRMEYEGSPAFFGTLLDITGRKRAEAAMEDRLRFEKFVADLSATFVNVPSERVDESIAHGLTELVALLGNDRCTVVRLTEDPKRILVTHSVAAAGVEAFPVGPMPDDQLPWYIGQFRRGKTVFLRRLPADLPPEADKERSYCKTHGIRSNVAIPLKAGGAVLGAITFAFLQRHCDWHEEIITRLQLIGEVFSNAIQRQRADDLLRAALAENEKLRRRLEQENQYLREQVVLKHRHGRFIGESDVLERVLAEAECVAVTDAPVLLLGETGTGKELLAETIHALSARKQRPMIVVNCASLPATLIESELFGARQAPTPEQRPLKSAAS